MKNNCFRIKDKLFSMPMKRKIFVCFTVLFLLTFLFVSIVYVQMYQNDIYESLFAAFDQTFQSCCFVIERLISDVEFIAETPLYYSQLQRDLETGRNLSSSSSQVIYHALSVLDAGNRHKYVSMFYDANNQLSFIAATISTSNITRQNRSRWFEAADNANGRTCLIPTTDTDPSIPCVAVKQIKSTFSLDKIGYVVIGFPIDVLDNACAKICTEYNARVLIYNSANEIIYDSTKSGSDSIPSDITAYFGQASSSPRIDTSNNIGYLSGTSSKLYSILIYAPKTQILSKLNKASLSMLFMAIATVIFIIVLTTVISNNITRPLRKITTLMQRVQDGDWHVRFHSQYDDEIGLLGQNFNAMLDRMNAMTLVQLKTEASKKQAEIDALKGQINPHFIYNMLETFQVMALDKDNFALAHLISHFGKMIRYNITLMNEITTIEKETEYLKQYIFIQNYRYENTISLSFDISEELMTHPIIKLLIQPVVENSIIHGLRVTNHAMCLIHLRAYITDTILNIEISDNGSGMSEEQLTDLRTKLALNYLESPDTTSVGLRNVNERISLYYGNNYGVRIDSTLNVGTTVTISIPYTE